MKVAIFRQRGRFALIGVLMALLSLAFLFYMGSSLVCYTKMYLAQLQ